LETDDIGSIFGWDLRFVLRLCQIVSSLFVFADEDLELFNELVDEIIPPFN
jgi:hypothetical protein